MYLGGGGRQGAVEHGVVGDLDGEVGVVYEGPSPAHPTRLVLVVESLEVRVAEEAAVPEAVAAVVGAGGRRRGRRGRHGVAASRRAVVRPRVGAAVLGTVVAQLERVQQADCRVVLEVTAAGPRRAVHTVAVRRQHVAEGRRRLRPQDTLLFQLHVVDPSALVQLAAGTTR